MTDEPQRVRLAHLEDRPADPAIEDSEDGWDRLLSSHLQMGAWGSYELREQHHQNEVRLLFQELPLGPITTYAPRLTKQLFPQFARLPQELRLKIWSYTLPTRRIISVHLTPETGFAHTYQPNVWSLTPLDRFVMPCAMGVTSESRAGISLCTTFFSHKKLWGYIPPPPGTMGLKSQIFDLTSDVLYFESNPLLYYLSKPGGKGLWDDVKFVAFSEQTWIDCHAWIGFVLAQAFKVKGLYIVVKDWDPEFPPRRPYEFVRVKGRTLMKQHPLFRSGATARGWERVLGMQIQKEGAICCRRLREETLKAFVCGKFGEVIWEGIKQQLKEEENEEEMEIHKKKGCRKGWRAPWVQVVTLRRHKGEEASEKRAQRED